MGSGCVADFALKAEPFLGGHDGNIGAARLSEVADLDLVSIAVPRDGGAALDAALRKGWGVGAPGPGEVVSTVGEVLLLGLAPDQMLAVLPRNGEEAVARVAAVTGVNGYLTGQSDNWVVLRLEGISAVAALERICPLDLHPAAFPEGRVARTVMEHLGTILVREGPQRFLLFSASSSARSFLHAVETSIRNVSQIGS
jgi:sarcosine oxidase subunit gamma